MSKNELTQMEKDEIKSRVKGMSKIEMLESIKHYPDEVVANELIKRIKEYKEFSHIYKKRVYYLFIRIN